MYLRIATIAVVAAVAASCGADGIDGASRATGGATVVTAAAGTTGTPETPAPVDPSSPATEAPADSSSAPVPEALDFTAGLVGGGELTGAELAGKDTVFWFWAPWCPTCAAASADVLAATEAHPEVTFVGVAGLSSDAASMEQFVTDHGVGAFAQIADTSGDVYTRFGVVQQHTFAFVSADGEVEVVPAYGGEVDIAALVDEQFG
jgi:thiol-disulfide isomerase/thioredoxin